MLATAMAPDKWLIAPEALHGVSLGGLKLANKKTGNRKILKIYAPDFSMCAQR